MRTCHFAMVISTVCLLYSAAGSAVPVSVLPKLHTPTVTISPAERAYREGLAALARGELLRADRAFASAAEADARFAPALLGRAEVAFRRQQSDAATRYLMQAAQVAPRDAYVQASLGRHYAIQRDYPKAEAALSKAIELDSHMTSARMDLADLYATVLNKLDKAIELYRGTIAQSPEHAGAYYALGIALADGDKNESKQMLTKAAQLDKSNPLPAIALARLSLQQGQPDQSLQWSDAALRIDANSIGAAFLRADALFAQNKAAEALKELSRLAAAYPKNSEVQFRVATAFHRTGKLQEAFDAYRAVAEVAPGNALAWNNLAALALELRKPPGDAVQWAKKATALAPNDAQFRDTLGWSLWKAGNKKVALTELQTANKAAPNDAGVLYHLGVVYAETNRDKDALDALNHALQIDPNFFAAADARARVQKLK